MQLLHGFCCFDFVSDITLSPAIWKLFQRRHAFGICIYKVREFKLGNGGGVGGGGVTFEQIMFVCRLSDIPTGICSHGLKH
jgi:hypothetical protein